MRDRTTMARYLAVSLLSCCVIAHTAYGVGRVWHAGGARAGVQGSASSEPWAYAAVDSESQADRPPLSDHRDSAGLLGAMIDGDVAIMFFEPPRFRTCPTEQLRGLRVTFSALNARHEGVARLVNGWLGHRVEFKPRKAEERLTVTLQNVPLEAVLDRLAGMGAVRVLEPPPLRRAP